MSYESNFDANAILEQLKKARSAFEKADQAVTQARKKKDSKIKNLNKILQEVYKKNIELYKKVKECEEKHG